MKKNNCQSLSYCLLFTACCLLFSCGGGLTDEQRKKIKKEMETSQIKRISEAQIIEAAMVKGRALSKMLTQTISIDSLAQAEGVLINWLEPGSTSAREIENQLIEAYITDLTGGNLDNVQRIGTDSLLYTWPVIEKQADSSDVVKGVWSIYISRKQLVLSMH
jgi:hypothetical protein